ncbi:AI-2E family transporter [Microbacterium betulae]|uniref:AI-2E family transporter n=1 Tax=Microbacterium betulae TaxID=2981139 RepID=A0AA97FG71_9MICO|nr:AI-2E family transporter [Microbacterium sp. AB]WOF22886.1 AI-2E family transporter [Microbacterium sp. AB]
MPAAAPRSRRLLLVRPYRTGLLIALGALTVHTAWTLLGPLAPVMWCIGLAAFFAIGLAPLVGVFQRMRLPRPLAVAAVACTVLIALAGILLLIVPAVVEQTTQLLARADEFAASGAVDAIAADAQRFVPAALVDVRAVLDGMIAGLASGATMQTVSQGVVGAGAAIGNGVFLTTMVLVLTMYFLASGRWFRGQLVATLPRAHRRTGIRIARRVTDAVGQYFLGQLFLALLNGALSLLLLLATGSALPLLFAAVALVCALIPLIGIPLGAAIVIGAQALIAPADPVPWVTLAVWYLVYMAVEAYVIAPRVIGRTVAMPAVVVLLVTLVGGTLSGILGALLALPLVVAASASTLELRAARRERRPSRDGRRPRAGTADRMTPLASGA